METTGVGMDSGCVSLEGLLVISMYTVCITQEKYP